MTYINSTELDDAIQLVGSKIIRNGLKRDKIAVVTRAAPGFGRAIALLLFNEGANTVL